MRSIIIAILLPILVFADTTYVQQWPDCLPVPGGVTFHLSAEQCRAAGLELIANRPPPPPPTAAEIAAQQTAESAALSNQQAAAIAESNRQAVATAAGIAKTNTILALRQSYRDTTAQLCQMAGVPVVPVLSMTQVQTAVMPLLSGQNAATVNGLITLLTNLEGKLCREDGNDALDRL